MEIWIRVKIYINMKIQKQADILPVDGQVDESGQLQKHAITEVIKNASSE